MSVRHMSEHMKKGNGFRVYLLRCADDTLYCGITNDLERRIRQHNDGTAAKYTRLPRRRPAELLVATGAMTRSEALRLEYQVKQQPRQAKVGFLEKYICKEESTMLTANNEVRAKNAEIALKAYQGAKGDVASVKQKAAEAEVALRAHLRAKKDPDDPVDREDNISDLLNDLLHLAKKEGIYNSLVPKSPVFPNLSDVPSSRAKEIDNLVFGLLHLAQQDGVEDIEALARRAKNNFDAECDPANEDEIAAFQSIANDLLIKHYGITLDDTQLGDLNVTVECLQQGHRPFEVVNEHAKEAGLDRIDKEGFCGVPSQDPLTAEDEKAVVNVVAEEDDEEGGPSPR